MSGLLKNIKFFFSILRSRVTKDYRPYQVQLTVTDHCNLSCSYCYANYPERGHPDLTTEEIFRIIDELAELGTRRVNLVGGEPLMRKDIGAIIDRIKERGLECAMTTNGYLVGKRLEDVKKLDSLAISLDGDKAANDANRGEGSFDAAMKAIQVAAANKVPLQVATVLTKKNMESVEFLLKLGKEYGFSVGFSTLISQSVDGVKETPEDIPTDEEYREVIRKIEGLSSEGYPVLFSNKTLDYTVNWPYGYEKDKLMGEEPDFDHIRCNAGRFYCIIDVNGDVYPCPSLVDVIEPRNCLTDGMKEAFRHINDHRCHTCHIPCQTEFNLMYSLDPSTIMHIVKRYRGQQ